MKPDGADTPATAPLADLPTPVVRRRHAAGLLIWLVPIAALAACGFYGRHYLADRGPEVVVRLEDVSMLQPGETPVRSRGVEIGRVTDMRLTADNGGAEVRLRLHREADAFARQGAQFWLVKPDLRGGSLRGLGTVLSGPYVEARVGTGDPQAEFVGLDGPPTASLAGLSIRLLSTDMGRVDRGTPVCYRGLPVGAVESATLSPDARHIVLRATIETRYAALVRANSRFWSEAPADIRGGIFSGLEIEVGTLPQLFSGRISFATPGDPLERPAMGDDRFVLYEQPKDEWKAWAPKIDVEPTTMPSDRARPEPPPVP